MARNTIDAIRTVERETADAEREAVHEANSLIASAREDGAKLIKESVAKAKAEAEKAVALASEKQKELVLSKEKETGKIVEELKKTAAARQKEAVAAILKLVAE